MRDDHGGWRLQTYDTLNRLVTVEDAMGQVLGIQHDTEGRQTEVYVGEVALIRYLYQPDGKWSKELVDLRTGEVLYQFYCARQPGGASYELPQQSYYQPARKAQAFLTGYSPIVEWDPAFAWDGHVLANLSGEPYALLPLDGTTPVWRSVTTRAADGFFDERIDYSAEQVVIHLATDAGGPDSDQQTVTIVLPRRPALESSQPGALNAAVAPSMNVQAPLFNIEFCSGDCICITRPRESGVEIIVRCPRNVVPGGNGWGGRQPRGPAGGGGREREGLGPGGTIFSHQRQKLNMGIRLARTRMEKSESCRDLFSRFEGNFANGLWILDNHVQFSNGESKEDGQGKFPCRQPGVAAWTLTNTRHVYICDAFRNLTLERSAVTVLHELLHVAGLRENPPDPTAMTSSAINVMVQEACGL